MLQSSAEMSVPKVELPKFGQMILLYPGYHHHGGKYHNQDLAEMIGGNHTNPIRYLHNTSPLRLSVALNRYGGRHAIGSEPITVEGDVIASFIGRDGQQYIYQNTAFGPFLAGKYGNPLLEKPNKKDPSLLMATFTGKQGIVRLVSYHHDHPGGHIALWDCDHFFQSPDWTSEHHMISVEFWETPDSYCAPKRQEPSLNDILQYYRLIPRHQETPGGLRHNQATSDHSPGGSRRHRLRHGHQVKEHRRRLTADVVKS
ncbi:hypothetical protein LSH36_39g16059 [Paralvinella palmiformis]|uniref:Uncharacterized protein n=1 Tax=Paralvinella palmiformis TaxID=53620 RepID=A0AAD9K837_9ANNE|nr:hypothetical protein LSH36_39g16059 [Paralvinella palmiformis]